jgi:tRNA(Arg) A34 adenosine deaminase TadA
MTAPEPANDFPAGVTPADLPHLRRCVELAAEAVAAGDFPFGSVLVAGDGAVLAEDRNRENSLGDATRHPEFELARWAAGHMTAQERAAATVFTSGEHCAQCAAAHAWVGLGRIVYVSSTRQLTGWLAELGVGPSPVRALAINEVAPGVSVAGPVPGLDEQVHDLHRRFRTAAS